MIKLINRSAIILRAKPEFEQWLASENVFASIPAEMQEVLKQINLSDIRANGTVFLMPAVQNDMLSESAQFIKTNADTILAQELVRWGASKAQAPAKPAVEVLNDWFDVTHHTNVSVLLNS